MSKNSVTRTLRLKEDKYKGETYYSLVGSVEMQNGQSVGVSIACDQDGQPKIYTADKHEDRPFVYARFFKFKKGERKKTNQL